MDNQEAIEKLKELLFMTGYKEALDLAIKALKNARPHGKWIMNKFSQRGRYYTCTNCEKISSNDFNFCPHCGADMREVDNE